MTVLVCICRCRSLSWIFFLYRSWSICSIRKVWELIGLLKRPEVFYRYSCGLCEGLVRRIGIVVQGKSSGQIRIVSDSLFSKILWIFQTPIFEGKEAESTCRKLERKIHPQSFEIYADARVHGSRGESIIMQILYACSQSRSIWLKMRRDWRLKCHKNGRTLLRVVRVDRCS